MPDNYDVLNGEMSQPFSAKTSHEFSVDYANSNSKLIPDQSSNKPMVASSDRKNTSDPTQAICMLLDA